MHDDLPPSTGMLGRSWTNVRAWISAALVILIGVAMLLAEAGGFSALSPVARIGVLVWLGVNLRVLRGAEPIFLTATLAVAALIMLVVPQPWPVLMRSLDQAALFVTFVATLNFLRDAAQSSAAVHRSGRYLISQSPPRRYLALTLGGHLFAIALNIGALNLLGAMVHRSNTLTAAGGDPTVVAIRERRMMSALSRGFAATLLWSPMGVSVAYTLSVIPGLTWFDLAPATLALALTWLALGWLLDRLAWPPRLRAAPPVPVRISPRELLPMVGITCLLLGGVIAAKIAMHSSLLIAVMSTVPFMALLWIALQYRRFGFALARAATGRRVRRHLLGHLPQARPEAVVLASAGFLGVALSALAAATGADHALSSLGLPPLLLALGAFLLIFLPAQIGITPLVTAALVGTALVQLTPPMPPMAIAVIIQASWSLSSCTSPFTGGSLILARMMGKSMFVLQRWNAWYAAACAALLATILAVWLR